jgi:hypothetical protein
MNPFNKGGAKRAVCIEKIAKWSEAELSNFVQDWEVRRTPLKQGVWERKRPVALFQRAQRIKPPYKAFNFCKLPTKIATP